MEMGFPVTVTPLGIQMHMAPRFLKTHDNYQHCGRPYDIIAGCAMSNLFARMFLFRMREGAANRFAPHRQLQIKDGEVQAAPASAAAAQN